MRYRQWIHLENDGRRGDGPIPPGRGGGGLPRGRMVRTGLRSKTEAAKASRNTEQLLQAGQGGVASRGPQQPGGGAKLSSDDIVRIMQRVGFSDQQILDLGTDLYNALRRSGAADVYYGKSQEMIFAVNNQQVQIQSRSRGTFVLRPGEGTFRDRRPGRQRTAGPLRLGRQGRPQAIPPERAARRPSPGERLS